MVPPSPLPKIPFTRCHTHILPLFQNIHGNLPPLFLLQDLCPTPIPQPTPHHSRNAVNWYVHPPMARRSVPPFQNVRGQAVARRVYVY